MSPFPNSAAGPLECKVRLEDAEGNLWDISGSSARVGVNPAKTTGAYRTGGSRWQGRVSGIKDADVELQIVYSQGQNEGLWLLKRWFFASTPGLRMVEIYIPDFEDGSDVYSGEMRIGNLQVPMAYSDSGAVIATVPLFVRGELDVLTLVDTGYMLTEGSEYMSSEATEYRMVWERG